MGYIFNFQDAVAYDKWFEGGNNRSLANLEVQLMLNMLKPLRTESVLDIGCGTGGSLLALLATGLEATGIDPSPYVLDIAATKVKNRADLYRGFAEDLPFDDNSFNHACFFSTLEFVDNPRRAIQEAGRVAKDRIFIGVLNRYAIKGIERRFKGIFTETIYNKARFFSIWELKQLIRETVGDVPMSWRTVCVFPTASSRLTHRLEQSRLIQRFPFGAFVGVVITLVPRFRTRPLTLKHDAKSPARPVRGFAGSTRLSRFGEP
jgi:SAM-dependent methyltransferase